MNEWIVWLIERTKVFGITPSGQRDMTNRGSVQVANQENSLKHRSTDRFYPQKLWPANPLNLMLRKLSKALHVCPTKSKAFFVVVFFPTTSVLQYNFINKQFNNLFTVLLFQHLLTKYSNHELFTFLNIPCTFCFNCWVFTLRDLN